MLNPSFSKVEECFYELLEAQNTHPAAQLTVIHKNEIVVNLYGKKPGYSFPITENTPFLLFSISKCYTAAAILHLMDRNLINLDTPIAEYWPEFAQGGKETATIRHALLHQAGIPAPNVNKQLLLWPNWQKVTQNVAREKAVYPPGTKTAYHLVNFGFILGEVVLRVTGKLLSDYLREMFFEPMGMINTRMQSSTRELKASPKLVTQDMALKLTTTIFNFPSIRRALIPATNVRSSAQELAQFFLMLLNDGEYKGRQYLKPETVQMAVRSHYDGFDEYIKFNMNWGLGFIVGGGEHQVPDPRQRILGFGSSPSTFAGCGMGTSMAWADRRTQTVIAFTCNGMLGLPGVDERWAKISNSVWDCVDA